MNASAAARLVVLLWLAAAAATAAEPEEPWRLVDQVRQALEEASPLAVDFTQLYRPAGFTSGESESGRVSLALPKCLKWEYQEPFERAYLLCGDIVWAWNAGEASGRRQRIAEEDQPGLDLLRLRVEALRRRYEAALGASDGGLTEVLLTPRAAGELRDAVLTIDAEAGRIRALRYHDAEGNLTRFDFDTYQSLAGSEPFAPPQLEWLDR